MTTHQHDITRLAIFALCAILLSGCQNTPAPSTANEYEFPYSAIGDTIEKFATDLQTINEQLLGSSSPNDADILLTVSNIPLTKQEFLFRQQLDQLSPAPRSEQELLNVLIHEKAKLALAAENDLLPTTDTIQAQLQAEQNDELLTATAQKFCDVSSLSLENYWNTYERYNITRLLIDDALDQYFSEMNSESDYTTLIDEFITRPGVVVYEDE